MEIGLEQALHVSTTVTNLPNNDRETPEDTFDEDFEPEE